MCDTPKIYSIGKSRTNKGLKLRHGHQERVFRIEFVSNNSFTDMEFDKWRETVMVGGMVLPTTRCAFLYCVYFTQCTEAVRIANLVQELIIGIKQSVTEGSLNMQ